MNAVEQRARSFFLRCRAHRWQSPAVGVACRKSDHFHKIQPSQTLTSQRASSNLANPSEHHKKPYYVTTPIYYVNAAPHVGHLYSSVIADIFKRWHALRGDSNSTLLTGTDEHGMKIQRAAEKAGTEVKLFCDQHAKQFLSLSDQANINYDRFIRTTDPDHKAAVEHVWRELNQAGWIYEAKHEGWYSVSDETFYPESQVHMVLDPSSGRKMHTSMETGKEVQWTSETNYHFRLSAFRDKLLKHYEQYPDFIVPRQRLNFIISEVESGLSDLSISRPSSRLSWGIRVPNDESQTIYVWLDALINYITMAGYPFGDKKMAGELWPPNCQVIGKDIIRFHCVYWPAFLMALDLPLPKQFLVHAHWTMNSQKMSKSSGNGVNPFYAMELFGVDTVRFFMARDGGFVDDAPYDNGYIIERYKKELQGQLGNLVSRLVRGKGWNVREAIEAASDTLTDRVQIYRARQLQETIAQTQKAMEKLNLKEALTHIMSIIWTTNKYFHDNEPWELAKSTDSEKKQQLNKVLFNTAESLRIAGILLQPFMPAKMSKALDMLGVAPANRTWDRLGLGEDSDYGKSLIELGGSKNFERMLFPPLAVG